MRKPPRWETKGDALLQRKQLAEDFHENLRQVAEAYAIHERAETVLHRHVIEAFDSLATVGLARRPWYTRPALEASFGVALLGLCPSVPDLSMRFLPTEVEKSATPGLIISLIIGGFALFGHAWLRGRLPRAPKEKRRQKSA